MPIICKITLDGSEYNAELEKVTTKTKDAKKTIESTGNKPLPINEQMKSAGKDISKAGSAAMALGGAVGAATPKLAIFGAVLQAVVLGPVALITAGIAALAAIVSEVWDSMTMSSAAFAAKAEAAAASAQRSMEKYKTLENATAGYLEKLKMLSSAENTANIGRETTARLLAILERQYGTLGAEIDSQTGKVKNLLEVMEKVQKRQNFDKAMQHDNIAETSIQKARASFTAGRGDEWLTFEGGAKEEFDAMIKNHGASASIDLIRAIREQTNDSDQLTAYNTAIADLEVAAAEQEKARNLRNTQFDSPAAFRQDVINREIGAGKSQQQLEETKRAYANQLRDEAFGEAKTIEEKVANRRLRMVEEEEKIVLLKRQIAEAEKVVSGTAEKQTRGGSFNAYRGRVDEDNVLNISRRAADATREKAELQKQLLDKEQIVASLNRDIVRANEPKNQFYRSLGNQAQDLQYQAMERSGQGKEAAIAKALRDAAEKSGVGKLDAETSAMVAKLAELSYGMASGGKGLTFDGNMPTNSLTARGGFSSGVKMFESEKINQQIANYNKDQATLLKDIKIIVEKLGYF